MSRFLPAPAWIAPALLTALSAQSHLYLPASFSPNQNELNRYDWVPLMQPDARVQAFYGATETGTPAFVATGISLRFDGPIPQVGLPGPFTIKRLRVRVGTSTVGQPQSVFADNLTSALATAFDQQVTYWPDNGSRMPEPWGGQNDTLTFPFAAPVPIAIPQGGWFVVELLIEGNDIAARAHAMLDGQLGSGGPVDGSANSFGAGCSAGANLPAATILTKGIHAPGAAHSIYGQNLGANAPVVTMLGASDTMHAQLGALPFAVPFTTCNVYTSWDMTLPQQANASGAIPEWTPSSVVAVPATPALNSFTVHSQLISIVAGANAPWNLVFSDKRTVTLGTLSPLSEQMFTVSHSGSATAAIADKVAVFGYAMRVRMQ